MTFEEFLALLPDVSADEHPIESVVTGWADYVTQENPRFVAPPLAQQRQIVLNGTSVVVISAAGAVGKSTVGMEIARRKSAPFVNLAARKVADDTAAGLVTNVFGFSHAAAAFTDLGRGALCLVLDSLDETRVGSGEGNFDAFLEGLAGLMKAPRARPAMVLLARTETADWITEWLLAEGVAVGRFSIDFFDEAATPEFVNRYVDDRSKQPGMSPVATGSEPFVGARDQLLQGIKTAVEGEETGERELIRSVLGYAPVLEAVSEYLLDEDSRRNYYRLLQALKREGREWELLLEVAEALLDREQRRTAKEFRAKLELMAGASWSDWDQLYSPEEQFQRLVAQRFGLVQPAIPMSLPVGLRHDYERAVQQALLEHPFRGSVDGLHPVFGEYLYARLLSEVPATASPLAERAREVLRSANYLPTRALGRYLLALTARNGAAGVGARDFGFLYESLMSDQDKPGDVWLQLRSAGRDEEHRGWIGLRGRTLSFTVTDSERGIWFWRRLAHAHVSVQCDLEVGFPGGDFGLGPAVNIECSTLRVPASELRIHLGDDEEGDDVVLVAAEFVGRSHTPVVRGKRFFVHSESPVPWPWSDYEEREPRPATATADIVEAYNHLARILLWFRARGHEEIARVGDLVEIAAGGTTTARDLLEFCVERGLLRRGALYELDGDALARYGINYVDLERRTLRASVIELLQDFLRRTRS